jgi:hypothetical protein
VYPTTFGLSKIKWTFSRFFFPTKRLGYKVLFRKRQDYKCGWFILIWKIKKANESSTLALLTKIKLNTNPLKLKKLTFNASVVKKECLMNAFTVLIDDRIS